MKPGVAREAECDEPRSRVPSPSMSAQQWLEVAVGVLPAPPCQVVFLRDDAGPVTATLTGVGDGLLQAQMAVFDARKETRITIPVEKGDRGGYSVICLIEDVFFLGGVDASVQLAVEEVRRRKPYRIKERVAVDAEATMTVLHAAAQEVGSVLYGRVLDISASGVGISATKNDLVTGDRVRFEATISQIVMNAEVIIRGVGRSSFGRTRIGGQFAALPAGVETALEHLVATRASASLDTAEN